MLSVACYSPGTVSNTETRVEQSIGDTLIGRNVCAKRKGRLQKARGRFHFSLLPQIRVDKSLYNTSPPTILPVSFRTCEPIGEDIAEPHHGSSRRHRPRAPLSRSCSTDSVTLISTTTTEPIHIHNIRYILVSSTQTVVLMLVHSPLTMASLAPKEINARVRGTSHIDFKTATTGVAAKAMRNEISHLVATVDDPLTKKVCFCA